MVDFLELHTPGPPGPPGQAGLTSATITSLPDGDAIRGSDQIPVDRSGTVVRVNAEYLLAVSTIMLRKPIYGGLMIDKGLF